MIRAGGCAAAVLALAGVAHAGGKAPAAAPVTSAAVTPANEPPDPAVEEAADANLESNQARHGLTFDASAGAGLIFGIGIQDSVGRGPAVSLRLGHVATRHTVITFEIDVTTALHMPLATKTIEANTSTNLLAGARYYVSPSLWLRGAGGIGAYLGKKVAILENGRLGDITLFGPAVLGGVGLDLARWKWAVLTIDAATSAMINREGVLIVSGLKLGLSFD
ncbi:MAG: hypothetical protein ABIY55_07555 [Kofleriaceae bacterium]